jgi:predicted Zn finger-like uncharacterized protein
MAIDVTCPSCHTRFQVSEKFAGKSGPCPKCKKTIKVPEKKDEVVIHAPEVSGPTDSTGVAILKPLTRNETRLGTAQIIAIVGSVVLTLGVSFVLRMVFKNGQIPPVITALGAVLLGPPLAFAAYTFLRDDELEPYRGQEVLLRSLACGLTYAALWGAYWLVFAYWFNFKPLPSGEPSWVAVGVAAAVMTAVGTVAAQASFELEIGGSVLNYAMYLICTVLLRFIMNMDPKWQQ